MFNRRWFLSLLSTSPFLAHFRPLFGRLNNRDYFAELGVRPVINAAGTSTALSGSLMRPEAIHAWVEVKRIVFVGVLVGELGVIWESSS